MLFFSFFVLSIIFCFLIFLSKNKNIPLLTNFRLSFIKTMLSILFLIFLSTESLSLFNKITLSWIGSFWIVFFCILLLMFIFKYKKDFNKINWKQVSIHRDYIIISLFVLCLIIFPLIFISFYYPPSIGDSITYHLPRIENWIQNKNVEHYLAMDVRQLFHQPFAEYIGLHLRLLIQGDYLLNFIQFLTVKSKTP